MLVPSVKSIKKNASPPILFLKILGSGLSGFVFKNKTELRPYQFYLLNTVS